MTESTAGWPKGLLESFLVAQGAPTPIQSSAWITLNDHQHALIAAPTGSGKTWAALLPILSDLYKNGARNTSVLWLSPLKALVADTAVRINRFCAQLREAGGPVTTVRVGARTGDVSSRQRSRDLAAPPDIWCVTPESLAIWLTMPTMLDRLKSVRWIVVDEVHALAASRRGADLALSLERLEERLVAPPRRIGLSATCKPLSAAGRFLCGPDRAFGIAHQTDRSELELIVEHLDESDLFVEKVISRIEMEFKIHQTIIVFTRTRAATEKLAWHCRKTRPALPIGIHHGSLTPETRRETEARLRAGELKVVFSSTSLELGMDIGAVGLVVLVHPGGEVVRLLQRVGRSGRGPGIARKGLILTKNPAELLEATVTATAGREDSIEPLKPVGVCADVLCQHLLAEAVLGRTELESLLVTARRCAPFEKLEADTLHQCLAYLRGELGHYNGLTPRLRLLPNGRHALASPRLRYQIRQWLGAISSPTLRRVSLGQDKEARVLGEIDPAFADLLRAGDRFLIEGRSVQVSKLSGEDVEVSETACPANAPRWMGEPLALSPLLARRLQNLRDEVAVVMTENPKMLAQWLAQRHQLAMTEAHILANYFHAQDQQAAIPRSDFVLAEIAPCADEWLLALHTPLPRSGNEAVARLIAQRLKRNTKIIGQSLIADLGLALKLESIPEKPAEWLRKLLDPENAFQDLEKTVITSDLVRRRFQEMAVTALMTPRKGSKKHWKRPKVGGTRWAAAKLFDLCLKRDPGFFLIRQAFQEIMSTTLDAASAIAWLDQIQLKPIQVRWLPAPSPFIRHWTQIGQGPELAPESPEDALSKLREKIMGVPA